MLSTLIAAMMRTSPSVNAWQVAAVMRNMANPPISAALANRFETWRGMARLQAGIVWKDGVKQSSGIFQTHEAAFCGNVRHTLCSFFNRFGFT